jgi:beta-galactosidase
VATYIGCGTSSTITGRILEDAVKGAGLWGKDQALKFPLITKSGINQQGKAIHYYFNYSGEAKAFIYPYTKGIALLTDESVAMQGQINLPAWGFQIVEEQ